MGARARSKMGLGRIYVGVMKGGRRGEGRGWEGRKEK
jgi:hypothetical protein